MLNYFADFWINRKKKRVYIWSLHYLNEICLNEFYLRFSLISTLMLKYWKVPVLEVPSSGLSGSVRCPATVDCSSSLLTGPLQLQRDVSLQIRRHPSFSEFAAFPALAFHEFSFSPGALTFHPLLHPLWYAFHSFHPSQCISFPLLSAISSSHPPLSTPTRARIL